MRMSKAVLILSLRRLRNTPNGIHIPKSYTACRNYTAMQDPERIHVLGPGNLGRLYAHALVTSPNPAPVTLLFHRRGQVDEWEKAGHSIEIDGISKFMPDIPSSSNGYDIDVFNPLDRSQSSTKRPKIKNLVIATKAYNTVKALNLIAGRLTPETTMLFAQNGVGVTAHVENQVLRELGPEYVKGYKASCLGAITSHGLYSTGPFRSVLAGYGDVVIGHQYAEGDPAKSKYLLDAITNAPLLNARASPWEDFMISVYQKLIINSTINPLSVVFQRKNGDLFKHKPGAKHKPIYELMRVLVDEMWMILGTVMGYTNKQEFSRENLEQLVLSVAEKTAENTSSMLQDFQAGRKTEIEYLNGWFIDQVREAPAAASRNWILLNLVKNGETLSEDHITEVFGLKESNEEGERWTKKVQVY